MVYHLSSQHATTLLPTEAHPWRSYLSLDLTKRQNFSDSHYLLQTLALDLLSKCILRPQAYSVSIIEHDTSNMASIDIDIDKMTFPDLPPAKKRKTEDRSVPVTSDLDDQDGNDYRSTSEDLNTEHDPGINDNESSDIELQAEDDQAEDDQAVKDDGTNVDHESDRGTGADKSTGSDESDGTEEDTGSDEGSVEIPPKRYGPNVVQSSPVQEALKNLRDHLEKLCTTVSGSDLAKQPTTFLHRIHEEALSQSQFKIPETRTLGFVGDSGAGM